MQHNQTESIAKLNFTQASLLVIEDNNDIWLIISMLMKRQFPEITIHRVVNARQTILFLDERVATRSPLPKLILQNLYLPLLKDGLDLLEDIRKRLQEQEAQQIPVLVMSSSDNHDDIRRAYQAGASSFYRKPTDISHWVSYFTALRQYWWESVVLPIG